MIDWADEALRVGAALAAGALIGVERGWHLREAGEGTRVAGIRTFTLLGLSGGLTGLIGVKGMPLVAAGIAFAAAALLVIGYAKQLQERADATTPIASLVTIAIGILAGSGSAGLAIAAAGVTVLVLAMREELHGFVSKLDEADVKALARFAVISLGVLPFLPSGHYGPLGAWNPQKLWLVVVLVTGFSFLGYAANRIFGERHGTIVTALIGGAYSSTAVTQSLAQRLGSERRGGAEPAGIALATSVMYLRVILLVAVLAARAVDEFALLIAPAFIVSLIASWWLYMKAPSNPESAAPGNPIAIVPALSFLAFVAVAAVAARWAAGRFGEQGTAILLLIVGSTDVDTAIITLGGLDPNAIGAALAALALAGTVLANMIVKLGITLVYARGKGVGAALALGASMVALAASLVVGWLRL
jgi:uncharacterized membrane protein (DUF4010 family)